MLYESQIWPVKEVYVMRLEINDIRMVSWMYNVRSGKIILWN